MAPDLSRHRAAPPIERSKSRLEWCSDDLWGRSKGVYAIDSRPLLSVPVTTRRVPGPSRSARRGGSGPLSAQKRLREVFRVAAWTAEKPCRGISEGGHDPGALAGADVGPVLIVGESRFPMRLDFGVQVPPHQGLPRRAERALRS